MSEENLKTKIINKIMNQNLETISYSIVFLSDILADEIFKEISDSWLEMLLKLCGDETVEVCDETKDNSIGIKEFKANNGLGFVYEMPHKLTIKYTKTKGRVSEPDIYIKDVASKLILALKKKTRIHKIGVNYEIFFSLPSPQEKIKNEIIKQHIKDDELESSFLRLGYKINPYTKLYLGLTTAKHDNKDGLYFQVNFDCTKKGDNQISDILSKDNTWLKIAAEKIEKLVDLQKD